MCTEEYIPANSNPVCLTMRSKKQLYSLNRKYDHLVAKKNLNFFGINMTRKFILLDSGATKRMHIRGGT